mgnify:FL=1
MLVYIVCSYNRITHDTELIHAFSNEKDSELYFETLTKTDDCFYWVEEMELD